MTRRICSDCISLKKKKKKSWLQIYKLYATTRHHGHCYRSDAVPAKFSPTEKIILGLYELKDDKDNI